MGGTEPGTSFVVVGGVFGLLSQVDLNDQMILRALCGPNSNKKNSTSHNEETLRAEQEHEIPFLLLSPLMWHLLSIRI